MKIQKLTVALILVGISLGLVACTQKKQVTKVNTQSNQSDSAADGEETGLGSLLDLFNAGKSVACGIEVTDQNVFDQKMYVSGKKMRTDMMIKTSDTAEPVESHMIMDGDYVYAWTSALAMGTKMNVKDFQGDKPEDIAKDTETKSASWSALNKKVSYKCSPWLPDASKFELPKGVEFKDISEELKKLQDLTKNLNPSNLTGSACSACDMLPTAELKSQCKQQANCSN